MMMATIPVDDDCQNCSFIFSHIEFFQLAVIAPWINLSDYNIATAQTYSIEMFENDELERIIFMQQMTQHKRVFSLQENYKLY